MNNTNHLLATLNIQHPIVQAPMAGISTPRLAAQVSNAGGLGSIGVGHLSIEKMAEQIQQTRSLTHHPFNVNVFCHHPPVPDPAREAAWIEFLAQYFKAFGAQPLTTLHNLYPSALDNQAMLDMFLEEHPPVVSFHFGVPTSKWIHALKQAGIVTMACATTLQEAKQIEQAGIDIVVAQGAEAGGHRGVFDPEHDTLMGTFALVRLLASRSKLPVLSAGGIMDGQGIAAAIDLGAAGVQMGTAFILCPESSASEAHRNHLKSEHAHHTAICSAISGRPARGLINKMYFSEKDLPPIPDYPIAYDAAKQLHQIASSKGCHDFAAHWAGQGAPLARELPAGALMQTLIQEWRDIS